MFVDFIYKRNWRLLVLTRALPHNGCKKFHLP